MRKKTAVSIIVILYLVVFVVLSYYLWPNFQELVAKYSFNPVKKLNNFNETEFYSSSNGIIFNVDRSDLVYPKDRLVLNNNFHNKASFPIDIESDFQIFVGEKNVSSIEKLKTLNLSDYRPNDQSYFRFSLVNNGTNEIVINTQVFNHTDHKSLYNQTEREDIQVESASVKLAADANQPNFYALIVSSIIGAVVTCAVITNIYYSRKQITMLKKQNDIILEKERPWLILEKGERIVDNVGLLLENIGNVPAEKIIVSCKPVFFIGKERSIPTNSEKDIVQIGIMVPKQKYNFTFNFLTVDKITEYDKVIIDIFVRYYFGKIEKTSQFKYISDKTVDFDKITCEDAT